MHIVLRICQQLTTALSKDVLEGDEGTSGSAAAAIDRAESVPLGCQMSVERNRGQFQRLRNEHDSRFHVPLHTLLHVNLGVSAASRPRAWDRWGRPEKWEATETGGICLGYILHPLPVPSSKDKGGRVKGLAGAPICRYRRAPRAPISRHPPPLLPVASVARARVHV
jgi:hypothetical protein